MKALSIILSLLLIIQVVHTAYCNGKPKDYFVNNQPIWKGNGKLIKTNQYG